MRRSIKFVAIVLPVLLSIIMLSTVLRPTTDSGLSIAADVLSWNSPQGESYGFKVNCQGCEGGHSRLEDCSLYDLDSVRVVCPDGRTYELGEDFSVNSYDEEVTRGWT